MTTPARRGTDAGITLVEMLVALAIFALVGVASFTTLDTILNVRNRSEGRLERLAALDRGVQVFSRDVAQADPLALTLSDGVLGIRLSGGTTRRYLLRDGVLLRETQVGAETPALQQALFADVDLLAFRALAPGGDWAADWPAEGMASDARAVEMTLTLAGGATLSRLVVLPDAPLPDVAPPTLAPPEVVPQGVAEP